MLATSFLGGSSLLASAVRPALASGGVRDVAADHLRRLPGGAVRLGGRLGAAIDLCIKNRVLAQDWRRLVDAFRRREEARCWQTEFWGKWVTSACSAYRYNGDPTAREAIHASARALLATQSQDGYLGNYAPDKHLQEWDVWGRKYTLLGLLAAHEVTGERPFVAAAVRLANHLMSEVGPGKADLVRTGNFRGMPSSSILKPMVQLHRLTGERRYRAFAEHITERWSSPDGPQLVEKALAGVPVAQRFPHTRNWWSWENGGKAYEMMSCYEGLLELARLTGRADHLQAVVASVTNIRQTELTIAGSGGSMECWYGGRLRQTHPAKDMMETCVTTTWMSLCDELMRRTGDPALGDEIERTTYNALLGAMRPDGSAFAKYSPLAGFRADGEEQCHMGLHCCSANGPRGLLLVPQSAVLVDDEGPVINLYGEGWAKVPLSGRAHVELRIRGTYPLSDTIEIDVLPVGTDRFTCKLRIPGWSETTSLSVGGETFTATAGTFARIDRRWRGGDRITLKLDLRGRRIEAPGGAPYTAIERGPVVLARDSRLGVDDVHEPATPTADQNGFVPLQPLDGAPSAVWMAWSAPFARGTHGRKGELRLCDYQSAGNAWTPANRYRVWIPQELDPSAGP